MIAGVTEAATWLDAIGFPAQLDQCERQLRDIHPIDRDAGQKQFLAACQELKLEEICQRLNRLRQEWIPSL